MDFEAFWIECAEVKPGIAAMNMLCILHMSLPQGSPQNRPTVVRAKPANGRGRGLGCFTPQAPVEASLF